MKKFGIIVLATLWSVVITAGVAIAQHCAFHPAVVSESISIGLTMIFTWLQMRYFLETRAYRKLYRNFFSRKEDYAKSTVWVGEETILQLKEVGKEGYDLNRLIREVNHYISKTKGTTDFSIIQNKTERLLDMRYDQSTARLSFPTFLGLMGTFAGVFFGIFMFITNFDGVNGVTDESITSLLQGVLVSMFTSLVGLLLTTISNAGSGTARTKIETDKNEFYDYVQTELMPSLDVSLVTAITKLHETVDKFEPAFNTVINNFQRTFDSCTSAFGSTFEQHVSAVAEAVKVMGSNMDKINENISLEQDLLETMKSDEMSEGLQRYIEASDHFVAITASLDKFEEARRMMLAAAQEAINIQEQYNESLKVPREVAVRVNQILDRIKDFEDNVNRVGKMLDKRDILADDVISGIEEQIRGIARKGKIANKFLEISDSKLEDLYSEQTKAIGEMNIRYQAALNGHIEGFEALIEQQTKDIKARHEEFTKAMEENLSVEEVKSEFINLRKLDEIEKKLASLFAIIVKAETVTSASDKVESAFREIKSEIKTMQSELVAIKKAASESGRISLFGGRR